MNQLCEIMFFLLWLLMIIERGVSWAPPDPSFEDFERAENRRRRLGINFSYDPLHISPEQCRYLSESQCMDIDSSLGRKIASRRLNPSIGTDIRIIVLLMEFQDNTRTLPPKSYFEELFNGDGPSAINTVGSVKEWMYYNSGGRYQVTFDLRGWFKTDLSEAHYAGGTSGSGEDLQEVFKSTMDRIQSDIDWDNGYYDDEGNLNHFVVLHSGLRAEVGDLGCIPVSHLDRIWSSGSVGSNWETSWKSAETFYEVNGWMIASAFGTPACDPSRSELLPLKPTAMDVIVHEMSHGFGLPDLYDLSRTMSTIGGIGNFGTMSSLQGWKFTSDTPGHLCAYSRSMIGWAEAEVITEDGFYLLQPLEIANSLYKIEKGYPKGEYLLIESKQAIKWDQDLDQGGVVIYHVDENVPRQTTSGYPGGSGWPEKHYRVAVVQADGLFQIEKGENIGDIGDFWVKGMELGSGGSQPNTDSYQQGVLHSTGVTIKIHSDPGLTMMIEVKGMGRRSSTFSHTPTENEIMKHQERNIIDESYTSGNIPQASVVFIPSVVSVAVVVFSVLLSTL